MKTYLKICLICISFNCFAQNAFVGKWKTIDEEGKAKSFVEIYESSGKLFGKIVEVVDPQDRDKVCTKCTGTDKNKPIQGLVIIKDMKKDGKEYTDGSILDPRSGKIYSCTLSLENNDKLKVRGFLGMSFIGRTQNWIRVK